MESESNLLPPRKPLTKRPEIDPTNSLKRGEVLRPSRTAKEILKKWGDPQPEPIIHVNKLF